MSPNPMKSVFLVGVILAGIPALATAASYTNNFSGTGGNTAFTTESPDTEWTVTGGVYQYSSNNTALAPSLASVSVPGVSGTAFTVETQFSVSSVGSINSNGATLGMGLFGGNSTFTATNTSNSYYLADWQVANPSNPGRLRILALGDTSGFSGTEVTFDDNAAVTNLAVNLNTSYTLRLVGTYVGSTLNMTLGVFDSNGNQIGTSATATDTSPLTGENFGYRNRVGLGGGTFTADFDNFSILPVPEPSSMMLLSLGATMAVLVRRRSAARA